MIQYWMRPDGRKANIAASLVDHRRGVGTNDQNTESDENPTLIPDEILQKYHFTFLIRHPRSSIPSYYRCTVPPLAELTGFEFFDPEEAGYKELRVLFDYLRKRGWIGPKIAGHEEVHVNGNGVNGTNGIANGVNGHAKTNQVEICLIDADDLLDNPYGIVETYCRSVGIPYSPKMLKWDDEETVEHCQKAFEKWKGFHEDAIGSKEFKPRTHVRY
jgi:hypothetical protein